MAHLEGRLTTSAARISKRLLAARVISAVPIQFLTFDAVIIGSLIWRAFICATIGCSA